MAVFKNLSEINSYVGKIVEQEIKKLGEEIRKALRQELSAKFYGREGYHPNQTETAWYERSFELLECISMETVPSGKNQYGVRIFYDTDKMNTYPSADGMWSKHESIIDGSDFREYLPEVIEYGNPSKLYGWSAFNIVGDLTERIKDDQWVLKMFVKAFESKGFKCVY